jgi:sterol desaturase/sphingolipid hydroxylase (fatty acid hydroxylase superfamily)
MFVYSLWLFGLSVLFLVAERLRPRRPEQRLLRRGLLNDVFYLVFNSEYLGLLIGLLSIHAIRVLHGLLDLTRMREHFYLGAMSDKPFLVQFIVLLVVFDLAQWLIHNSLHRIPFLWEFHKVHHSVEEMDWIGNWRFHWFEAVFYRSLLYVPAAFFGFSGIAMFWYGVLNTAVGHFAHSNLRLAVGPLKYVINSPEMHIWHHSHPEAGPVNRNFGITLSVWDWIFKTAHLPSQDEPRRLGFSGIQDYPRNVFGQAIAPFLRRKAL